jgi:hypothetical protein
MPIAWLVSLLVLLTIPSAPVHRFDGLPFSRVSEYAVLMLLVPLLPGRTIRRAFTSFWGRRRALGRAAFVLVAAALAMKAALFVWAPPDGFLACYRSPVQAPPTGPCERSYENPFFRRSVTRVDRAIDFGPATWNLSFVNSVRWNFYYWEAGKILRERLPLEVGWRGSVARARVDVLEVHYVGAAVITLGDVTAALPRRYDREAVVTLPVPIGSHRLAVRYTFDDGYRTGAGPPSGPAATFRLRWSDGALVYPERPPTGWLLLGAFVDGVVVGCAAWLVAFYGVVLRRDRWWLLALSLAGPVMFWSSPALVSESAVLLVIAALLLLRLRRRRATGLVVAFLVLLYLGFFRRALGAPDVRAVLLRGAGDDWLYYESFGRSILESWSLEGGEPVYFLQPLVRYASFLFHLTLGDGDTLIAITRHTLIVFAFLWCVTRLRPCLRGQAWRRAAFELTALCAAALMVSESVVSLARVGASEVPTWIALTLAIPLLFVSRSPLAWLLGAGLLALSYVARGNHAPAVAWLLASFAVRGLRLQPRRALVAVGLFGVIAVLPLVHNVVYGHRFVLLTTSGSIPRNLDTSPAAIVSALSGGEAERRMLRRKATLLLHAAHDAAFTVNGAPTGWVTELGFHGLQAAWLAAGLGLLVARAADVRSALLATPALYLGIHVIYTIDVYYPRHIVAGYLAMGLASMAWWGRCAGTRPTSRTDGASVAERQARAHGH